MLSDVRNYYGLARDFGQAGYFETEHSEQIVSELKLKIKAEKLVALSGIVGYGKTTTRALEEAYKVGQKSVGADMIENVLAMALPKAVRLRR